VDREKERAREREIGESEREFRIQGSGFQVYDSVYLNSKPLTIEPCASDSVYRLLASSIRSCRLRTVCVCVCVCV
jgi:hypothetical protein